MADQGDQVAPNEQPDEQTYTLRERLQQLLDWKDEHTRHHESLQAQSTPAPDDGGKSAPVERRAPEGPAPLPLPFGNPVPPGPPTGSQPSVTP